jgi:Leucine-rich repeat (LRR) protein
VKLSHLQSIHLSDNEFTEIPSVLLELPLTYLYLVNNYITKVPINIPESRLRDNDGVFISKVGLLVQQGVSEDTLSNKPVP